MTTAKKTTRDLRIANTRRVLETIQRDGPISAARLSERCELRPSTISNILKEATARGAVRSCGYGESTRQGGKRPLLLELDPGYGWLAGAELSRAGLRLAVRDFALGARLERHRLGEGRGARELLAELENELRGFIQGESGRLRGLGLALRLPPEEGLDQAIAELGRRLGCPVRVERPAALAACGEWLIGRQREPEGLVWLGLEEGEQGWRAETGVVLDGRLRSGAGPGQLVLPAAGGDIGDVLRLVASLLEPELIVVDGGPEDLVLAGEVQVSRPGFGDFAIAEGGVALAFEEALESVG
ncbi:MAG: ROK family protein [Planctomycetes bacterium]|nr:ROK family protein [Planctomycetota bacterium]